MDCEFIFFSAILFIQGFLSYGMTSSKAMSAMCKAHLPVFVNHSLILELTNEILEDNASKFLHCAVDVITKPRHRILIHFVSLDISFDNRSPDRLHIYDYSTSGQVKQMTPAMGLFGVYDSYYKRTSPGVEDYKSSSNKLKLDYQGRPSLTYSGFRILITAFKEPSVKGNCGKMYRKCTRNKKMCVPLEVMCDLEFNCGEGDQSDEDKCDELLISGWDNTEATTMAAVAALIAIGTFLLIIIIVVCFVKKYTKRKYIRQESVQVGIKKKPNGDWSLTNNVDRMGVTEMYAPPTYEDAVAVEEEPPPAYDALTTPKNNSRTTLIPNHCHQERTTVVCIETNCARSSDNFHHEDSICDTSSNTDTRALSALPIDQISAMSPYSCRPSSESAIIECETIDTAYSNDACDKKSNTSSRDSDSGNFAGCSSQASSSCQNDDDFNSVASEQLLLDKSCDIIPNTEKYLPVGKMNDLTTCQLSSNQCKTQTELKPSLKIDLQKRICILNCDDIEYVDDDK